MNAGLALDWGICGVGVLPSGRRMAEVLAAQDHLYTLVVKHPDGILEPRVIGSIVDYLFAPDDPAAVVDRLTDPAVRMVSLTITEGGYHIHPVTGRFESDDEAIRRDLAAGSVPRTSFGLLTEALSRRRQRGIAPFAMERPNESGNEKANAMKPANHV
jgi:mannitol 2-dehydrogenase